jgi:MSHA biogenesis protein MshP
MSRLSYLRRERGVALVGAIFIVVILGMMGGFLVSITGVANTTTIQALQGAKAHKAAIAGLQWAVYKAMDDPLNNCGLIASSPQDTTLNFTAGALNEFSADVTCSWTQHEENGCTFEQFSVESVGEYGNYGERYYFSRRMQAVISNMSDKCG